jgi:hypothetical protein
VAKSTAPHFKKAALVDFFFEEVQYMRFQARRREQPRAAHPALLHAAPSVQRLTAWA